ncbi:coatomer subunit gamma [Enteropsectra breve]|nr:coatomer subunit gamma [Enteropsectra breve]
MYFVCAHMSSKNSLKIAPADETIRQLSSVFDSTDVIPREAIKTLNSLLFTIQNVKFHEDAIKQMVIHILKGLTTKDEYLKSYIYVALLELSRQSKAAILAVNFILKDLDSSNVNPKIKSIALRVLYAIIPAAMRYDFEKYVKPGLISSETSAVVLASEYLPKLSFSYSPTGKIADYYACRFAKHVALNHYTCLAAMNSFLSDNLEKISSFLFVSSDPYMLLEATKALSKMNPEESVFYVDKAVHSLQGLVSGREHETIAALRVLRDISAMFPAKAAELNNLFEDLVKSSSTVISMLAILVLLKTGNEHTVRKLSSKLKPIIGSLSAHYRMLAVDAIESLYYKEHDSSMVMSSEQVSESKVDSFTDFLFAVFAEKGELRFKRYIILKFERLLQNSIRQKSITDFFCEYMEDSEHYQITVAILGLLGRYLCSANSIIHIFNRLILDNLHVRKAALQTLFELHTRNQKLFYPSEEGFFFNRIASLCDKETWPIFEFLRQSCNANSGNQFQIDELGALKDAVLGSMSIQIEAAPSEVPQSEVLKVCRSIEIMPKHKEFSITLQKTVRNDGNIIFDFCISKQFEKGVVFNVASLKIESSSQEYEIPVLSSDFINNSARKELIVPAVENEIYNGILEYQVCMEDDSEEEETDSLSILPFTITPFDFVQPKKIKIPETKKETSFSLPYDAKESAARIAEMVNMELFMNKSEMYFMGEYGTTAIAIKVNIVEKNKKCSHINAVFSCDDTDLTEKLLNIFE